MAGINRYRCLTCNTDLGADGATVESHLVSNPTHSIKEIIFDGSKTIANIEGTTRIYNNELYTYDNSRSLWLSVRRLRVDFGIPSTNQRNTYLRLWGIMVPVSADMGFLIPANATITSLIATRSSGTSSAVFSLRVYGGADIITLTLEAGILSGTNLSANTNVAANTILSSYLAATSNSNYPQFIAEVAYRI